MAACCKFSGSYRVLQEMIGSTMIPGQWINSYGGQKQFRTEAGGILNWWPSTGTINFQGKERPKAELEVAMRALLQVVLPPGVSVGNEADHRAPIIIVMIQGQYNGQSNQFGFAD